MRLLARYSLAALEMARRKSSAAAASGARASAPRGGGGQWAKRDPGDGRPYYANLALDRRAQDKALLSGDVDGVVDTIALRRVQATERWRCGHAPGAGAAPRSSRADQYAPRLEVQTHRYHISEHYAGLVPNVDK